MRVTEAMRKAASDYTVDGIEWAGRCPECGVLFNNLPLHVRHAESSNTVCTNNNESE